MGNLTHGNPVINKTHKMISEKIENSKMKNNEDLKSYLRKNNNNIFNSIKEIIDLCENTEIKENYTYLLASLQTLTIKEIGNHFKEKVVNQKVILYANDTNANANKDTDETNSNNKETNDTNVNKEPAIPFIKSKSKKRYTLILDLDETLIHLEMNKDVLKGTITFRPGLFEFLDEVSKLYELIIFTCGTAQYANPIIDSIEKEKKYFDHRLFRIHTTFKNNEFIKDLSSIGRELQKTIIIDNTPQNFRLQKENGIFIKSFYSTYKNDRALLDIIPFLKKIVENRPDDIRKELSRYKKEIDLIISPK